MDTELHTELVGIRERLTGIETTLKERGDDHDQRLRTLEAFRTWVLRSCAGLTVGTGLILASFRKTLDL